MTVLRGQPAALAAAISSRGPVHHVDHGASAWQPCVRCRASVGGSWAVSGWWWA